MSSSATVGGTDSLPTGSRVGQTDPLPTPWQATELAWVAAQASPNTRRHYRTSWVAFQQFMGGDADPLRITSDDVNAWIASLRARGQAASTIASRVAACASLFDFIAHHAPELLTDRHGRLRSNPFRNEAVRRPRVKSANGPQPLADATVQGLLGRINTACLSGARDQAFLLTALTTGWQTAALVGLRWAGRRAAEDGEVVELWQHGAAQTPAPLPPAACGAIRHYLTLAGRWPLAAGEPVWLPLRSDGVANFGRARPDARRPISGAQANNILRRRLRLAGVPRPEQYHVRDLRHTFARKYLAVGGDANGLGRQLEHARPSVTQHYIARLTRPMADDALLAGWV
jgi:site-specific recombinase XerD